MDSASANNLHNPTALHVCTVVHTANIIKQISLRINCKKYYTASVNSKEPLNIFKTRCNAYLGLYPSIYVIKSPIYLARQSL